MYIHAMYTIQLNMPHNSAVRRCSDVSENRFNLDITIGEVFRHASDANGRVKVNEHNTVHDRHLILKLV